MKVFINDEPYSLSEKATVFDLFDLLDMSKQGVAIAVNEQIVPRSEWDKTNLLSNDKIIVVRPTAGG